MGVGAIFISTLAVHQLPTPLNPPQTQKDILALCIHPIVSFVVFTSIIVRTSTVNRFYLSFNLCILLLLDGLSIPFFNLGKNVSRTVSLTTTLTSPRSMLQPDWISNINRTAPIFQGSTSEVPDVPLHDVASPASSNSPTITIPSQTTDIESGLFVDAKWNRYQ